MKIAINGFGRIGRLFFRQAYGDPDLEIVAVNDLGDIENLKYLLSHDTVYGKWDQDVDWSKIRFVQEKDITKLPWKDVGADIVIEATGFYDSFAASEAHVGAGAKRVVITAPAKDDEKEGARTVLNGVNENLFASSIITSNGSCTTNSASPVVSILSENPGIEKAMLNTVHAYTATQRIVDGPDAKDWRRGRAAAMNIVPSTTGAAIAVTRAVESLKGKFDGIALRVPVVAGSLTSITFLAKRNTSAEEINKILSDAAASPRWRDVFKVSNDHLVSVDIQGEPYGAIVDAELTRVVDGNMVQVFSWYDNEWGYVHTLKHHVKKVAAALTS